MKILESERFVLRHVSENDAPFILKLLNDPEYISNIRDSQVRDQDGAKDFIRRMYVASYEKHDIGLLLVEDKMTLMPVGLCGLIRRDGLPDIDIGYAIDSNHRGKGIAQEVARATLEYGFQRKKFRRSVAIVSPNYLGSIKVLENIGFVFEKMVRLNPNDIELKLYSIDTHVFN